MEKQADLIAKWQSVGFIHGVMNTDNTLISGETIDYGPCAFMDIFKEDAVFSSIDTQGRYSYKNQPYIISWNLMKLVEALLPLFDKDATTAINKANEVLSSFEAVYQKRYLHHMSKKLGILQPQKEDILLINELLLLLEKYELDFTNTFHMLSTDYQNLFAYNRFDPFLKKWEERIKDYEKEDVLSTMRKSNPIIIPRNILVEEALDSANSGDFTLFNEFLLHLKDPFNYSKNLPKKFRIPNTTTSFVTYCGT